MINTCSVNLFTSRNCLGYTKGVRYVLPMGHDAPREQAIMGHGGARDAGQQPLPAPQPDLSRPTAVRRAAARPVSTPGRAS